MMKYRNPFTRLVSAWVSWLCCILFSCFAFCYLYFYQPEYMAQLQYHFSHGETSYQALLGAALLTLPLSALGVLFSNLFRWPIRCLAFSWFPSAFLLTALTSLRMAELPGYQSGTPFVWLTLSVVLFVIVFFLCQAHLDASGERVSLPSCLSSNLFILCGLFLMIGGLGYSSASGHRELRVGRLFTEQRYAEVLQSDADTSCVSHRLFALRVASLAATDSLGYRLFAFHIPAHTSTLLPDQSDSLFVYDALPVLYRWMKAVPLTPCSFSDHVFLRSASRSDSLGVRCVAKDYLLCTYLVRGELDAFLREFVSCSDSLRQNPPTYYREALVMFPPSGALQCDSLMRSSYSRFLCLRKKAQAGDSTSADSLRTYAHTYWAYYHARFR